MEKIDDLEALDDLLGYSSSRGGEVDSRDLLATPNDCQSEEREGEKIALPAVPVGDRRFSPEGNQTYTVKKIWESHKEIMRRVLLGQKNVDIARALGITPQTVSNVRNNPLVRDQISLLEDIRDNRAVDISRDIKELSPIALKVMETAMQDPGSPWGVKVRSAMDLLDRAGWQAPKQVNVVHAHLTHEAIQDIKDRARRIGISPNQAQEVEEAQVVSAE